MILQRFRKTAGVLACTALILTACSSDDDGGETSTEGEETEQLTEVNSAGLPIERFDNIAIGLDDCVDAEAFGAEGVTAPDNVETIINLIDNAFCQDDVTLAAGATVLFVSNGNNDHFIKSGTPTDQTEDFESGAMFSADTFVHTFSEAGTFSYFCSIHADFMTGTVTVTE